MVEQGTPLWASEAPGLHDPLAVASGIGQAMGDLRDSLGQIESAVLEVLRHRSPAARPARSSDLSVLQPLVQTMLDDYKGWICGAGFVAEPGVLADCTYWLEWRTESKGGSFSRLEVTLDESDIAKYDYFNAAWFQRPRCGAGATLAGPYVDWGGVNKYLVTLSLPVHHEGLFLGIVGADILVERVEGMLRRAGRSMNMAATIVNEDGRIIASSIPRLHPGVLIRGIDISVVDGENAAPGIFAYRCGQLPWTLLVAPPAFPVQQLLDGADSASKAVS